MAITVFDAVGKFSAETSELDQFTVKLEQGLSSASDKAAASTRALKQAHDEFREAIKAVSAEGGSTINNMARLGEAEKNLALTTAAAKREHDSLRDSIKTAKSEFTGFNDVIDKERDAWDGLTPRVKNTSQGLGEAGGKAKEAGGSMKEARESIMLLGEQFGIHVPRAVASFIASIAPLRGLLAGLFPILGGLALIGVVGELSDHFHEYEVAVRKAAEELDNLNIKETDRATGIEIETLRLEDEIEKLESRPETNKLAAALLEVQSKTNELNASFAEAIQKAQEALDKEDTFWAKLGFDLKELGKLSYGLTFGGDKMVEQTLTEAEAMERLRDLLTQITEKYKGVEEARLALSTAEGDVRGAHTAQEAKAALDKEKAAVEEVNRQYLLYIGVLNEAQGMAKLAGTSGQQAFQQISKELLSANAAIRDNIALLKQDEEQVKLVAEEQARAAAKRAEDLAKIKIEGKERMGILNADAIRQAGEQAYAAEQAAIKKILGADQEAGQEREQAELGLIPRMAAAEKAVNDAQLSALKSAHATRLQALEAEHADILKYEKGDDQVKALEQNLNRQNEENKKYELDRQKLASDGETKLTDIAAKGAADRVALQRALQKATQELVKANEELLKSETRLAEADISSNFKAQEEAITRLAQFHLISEREKANRLAVIYQQESEQAINALEKQIKEEQRVLADAQSKLNTARATPFFSEIQLKELEANLDKAHAAVNNTEAKLVDQKAQTNQKLLALDQNYYGEAVSLAVAAGEKLLTQQLMENHASLIAAQQRLAEAKAHHENTDAIEQEVKSLKKIEQELTKEALGRKHSQTAIEGSIHAALLDAQVELAAAKARGANTQAIEKQIQALQKLEVELKKEEQTSKTSAKEQLSAWQQFGDGFREDAQKDIITLQQMGDEMRKDLREFAADLGAEFAAMIQGQESFGEAMAHATEKLIGKMAQQWGEYFAAKAIADIWWNPALGAAEFAAAAALFTLGSLLSSLGGGSSSSGSGSSSSGTAAASGPSAATQPAQQPVQTLTSPIWPPAA
jgi:hypothetical protein